MQSTPHKQPTKEGQSLGNLILCGKHNIIVTINIDESIKAILKHIRIYFSYLLYLVLYLLLAYCAIEIIMSPGHNPIFLQFLADKPSISLFLNLALISLAIVMFKKILAIILTQIQKYFLDSKCLKLTYYRCMAAMLKLWSAINIPTLILLMLSLLIIALLHLMTYINFDYLKLSDIILVDKVSTLEQMVGLLFIFIIILALILGPIMIVARFIFRFMLPINKLLNISDTSDIPISFIEEAIKELESFEYNAEWDKRQANKNKISNLINNALDFVSIEDKIWEIPREFRYYTIMVEGINNRSSRKDVLSWANGLHRKMNNIANDLNCINDKNKENIIHELTECSNIIKNKEICAVEKIDFIETRKIFRIYELVHTRTIYLRIPIILGTLIIYLFDIKGH